MASPTPTRARSGQALALVLGVAMLLAASYLGWSLRPAPTAPPLAVIRFTLELPAGLAGPAVPSIAISADGATIALAAGGGDAPVFLRPLDRLVATPVAGSEGGRHPFFSWDGTAIGFERNGRLLAAAVGEEARRAGDRLRELRPARDGGELVGAGWARDGSLVVPESHRGPILRIGPAGERDVLTQLQETAGETGHDTPHILPGGRGVLFTARRASQPSLVAVVTPPAATRRTLVEGARGTFLPLSIRSSLGHLVYVDEMALFAAAFELDRMRLLGDPVRVVDRLAGESYDLSPTGTLAYVAPPTEPGGSPTIHVVVGWAEEVRARVPLQAEQAAEE